MIPPYITIAGQTAPGNGIMIRGMEHTIHGPDVGGGFNTHDVIMRHVRLRNKAYATTSQCNVELIGIVYGAYNVIIDHVSGGWNWRSAWGAGYNAKGVTYQWTLLSEGLQGPNGCGSPAGSEVSLGSLFSSIRDGTANGLTGQQSGLSFLHNYVTHFDDRVPFNSNNAMVQAINNVVYNTRSGSYVQNYQSIAGENTVEYINNYLQRGPQAQDSTAPRLVLGAGFTSQPPTNTAAANSQIYLSGNYHNVMRPTLTQPETDFVLNCYDYGQPGAGPVCMPISTTRYSAMPTVASTVTAAQARADVLAKKMGAYGLLAQGMDTIDLRAIRALQNGTGGTTSATSVATACSDGECGETGSYPAGTPYTDTDGDGIADSWETSHGLNPNDAADGPLIATNGYSNLENYLNELAGDTPVSPMAPQLLLHWPLSETSGLAAADVTGHGYTGTLIGSPTWRPGLTFNGSTQYVSNTALPWTTGQSITVALWVKTPGGTPGGAFSVGMATNRIGAHIPYSDNVLYWDYGPSFPAARITTNFAPYLNKWTHVALVSNGTNFKGIYLNGQLVTSDTSAGAPTVALTGVEVGRYNVGGGIAWHTGLIRDFRLYNTVLTTAEIQALYYTTARVRRLARTWQ